MSIKGINKKIQKAPKRIKEERAEVLKMVSKVVLNQVELDAKLKEISRMCMKDKNG